jgi:hypothetical protein
VVSGSFPFWPSASIGGDGLYAGRSLRLDMASGAVLRERPSAQAPLGPLAGRIAQVVEQLTLNQRVVGSSPTAPTNLSRT